MSEYEPTLHRPVHPDLTSPLQLWKVESTGEERKVTYLSTLIKHTQAVNVVRFSPKGGFFDGIAQNGESDRCR